MNHIDADEEMRESVSDDCCGKDHGEQVQKNSRFSALAKKNPIKALWVILVVVLVANIAAMTFFTVTVNSKLSDAVELVRPQEGTLTLVLPSNCPVCGDLSAQKKMVSSQNIELLDDRVVSADSTEGKTVIEKFGIRKLPALVFVTDEKIKDRLARALEQGARPVGENTLLWEQEQPPYMDAQSTEVTGLVGATYLTDKDCIECYDVQKIMRPILQQFGVVIVSEDIVDVSDARGKELVEKYTMTRVPALLLSSQASAYSALEQVWGQVGTVEQDGVFVFRDPARVGATYKDLEIGKTVAPDSGA